MEIRTRSGWVWVARPHQCGSCGHALEPGELGYFLKTGRVRCRDCGEDTVGLCQLSYDTAPLESGGPALIPPAPSLEGTRSHDSHQLTISETELRLRQAKHARRLERWHERQKAKR